jgi:sugar-specific transcriptional regulator TrmB
LSSERTTTTINNNGGFRKVIEMDLKLILKSLCNFELNTYEAKSYLSLLEKNNLTAVEVAKLSSVPRGRIYEILDNLEQKGLCNSIPGKVTRFKASDPAVLTEKIKGKIHKAENEIEKKKRELDELKRSSSDTINELIPLFKNSRNNNQPLDYIEILKNRDQIYNRYNQLCNRAKSEILGFAKPPFAYNSPKLFKEQIKILTEAVKRNVKMRAIYELPADEDSRLQLYKDINNTYEPEYEELRLIERLPIKASIIDGLITLVVLEYPVLGELSLTGLVIDHQDYSEGFRKMFEAYWNEGIDHYIFNNQ